MSDAPSEKRLWNHRRGDSYVLIVASAVGNTRDGFRIEHSGHRGEYRTVVQAAAAGFTELDRSDDFNIGVVRQGHLVALLWMDEIVDDEPAVMARVAAEVGLA